MSGTETLSGDRSVSRHVADARDILPEWGALPPAARAKILAGTADLLADRRAELRADLVAEARKPISEAEAEIDKTVGTFAYYGGLADALAGRAFRAGNGGRYETWVEPVGVAAAITAWNVPAAGPARKLAPAVLAGAPILLKPAEATPAVAGHLVRALRDAGAPDAAVQLVVGTGPEVGAALVAHPDVRAVSFTGSTRVGREIERLAAGSFTRLQLELGGKNAAVVLADADLDRAVDAIVAGAFTLAGQQCTATSRIVVADGVYDELLDRLLGVIANIRVGRPEDPQTQMGPLISVEHRDRVHAMVTRAAATAKVRCGGRPLSWPGAYYPPTVLTGVDPTAEIAQDEVFGPVVAVLRFDDVAEGIRLLDGTDFGLSVAVHTRDVDIATNIARQVDHGVVSVNGSTAGIEISAPFGGFKASGNGGKEHGPEGLELYTRTKLVSWSGR